MIHREADLALRGGGYALYAGGEDVDQGTTIDLRTIEGPQEPSCGPCSETIRIAGEGKRI